MALPIPRLDDLSYADLVQEAVSLLPALAPEWTNHNPSDPGITLVELLAWRAEMLVYRADQVPPEHVRAFLRLIRGPDDKAGAAPDADAARLDAAVRTAVAELRGRWRAVTAADYELLSTGDFNAWKDGLAAEEPCWRGRARREGRAAAAGEGEACEACEAGGPCDRTGGREPLAAWWDALGVGDQQRSAADLPSALPAVARARCFPRADMTLPGPLLDREGHLSVVAVPRLSGGAPPAPAVMERLCRALWGFLDERRLVGVWHHVVPPIWVPVHVEALVALREDVPDRTAFVSALPDPADEPGLSGIRDALTRTWGTLWEVDSADSLRRAVTAFLDPVEGGRDGEGWPMGRSVFLSELYELLERLGPVEWVPYLEMRSEWLSPPPAEGDELAYGTAPETWNPDGDMIGLRLSDRQLPVAQVRTGEIHISDAIVPVEVTVRLVGSAAYDGALLGSLRRAARRLFPPFVEAAASAATAASVVRLADVRAALEEALRGAGRPAAELGAVTLQAPGDREVRDRGGAVAALRFRAREAAHVRTTLEAPAAPEAP